MVGRLPAVLACAACLAGQACEDAEMRPVASGRVDAGPVPSCRPAGELCNGVDDDCDGATDEHFGVGAPCSSGRGRCFARGRTVCAEDGTTTRCDAGEPREPIFERCNGADDDCDGETDEGFDLGAPCEVGVGACRRPGVSVCATGGAGTACLGRAAPPVPEVCNGADDDCDGETDEGLGLGEACRAGVGGCARFGVRVCGGAGRVVCDAPEGRAWPETCNRLDDDCDGETDEDFDLGAPCEAGEGRCRRPGRIVCADAGGHPVCSAQPGAPEREHCNGLDDDCDGETDEAAGLRAAGVTGVDCAPAPGPCLAGMLHCRAGELVCLGQGQAELCDGVDNDCDGEVDEHEDLLLAGRVGWACQAGLGECGAGLAACRDGELVCEAAAEPGPEVCDGLDNDCDGETDELADLQAAGEVDVPCGTDEGTCVAGSRVCRDGQLVCHGEVGPTAEVCDGLDSDCDGEVDGALPGMGEPCGSDVGPCQAGIRACTDGEHACEGEVPPEIEVCNGEDDDCDGEVDEDAGCDCRDCYTDLAVGRAYACLLRGDGTIGCFGSYPEVLDAPDGRYKRLSAAWTYACALDLAGLAHCWGGALDAVGAPPEGPFSALSAGSALCGLRDDGRVECRDSEGPLEVPEGQFVQVSAGDELHCAVRDDGTAVCWGHHGPGDLQPPERVFAEVRAGWHQACGRTPAGDVVCWGDDRYRLEPPDGPFVQLRAAGTAACGVREDGSLECWGSRPIVADDGPYVRVDVGSVVCALRLDGQVRCWEPPPDSRHADLAPLVPRGPYRGVAVGRSVLCGLHDAGRVVCWSNSTGAAPPAAAMSAIAAGHYAGCGLREEGWLQCWGRGERLPSPPPDRFVQVSMQDEHACALTEAGQARCWGWDTAGETAAPAEPLTEVAVGETHTCGLRPDATVRCWGNNGWGKASPPPGMRFVHLAASSRRTCGLRDDGSAVCWGDGRGGHTQPPHGRYTSLALGTDVGCGLLEDGAVRCWGRDNSDAHLPPEGRFVALAGNRSTFCGVEAGGGLRCWGGSSLRVLSR